jgi:glucose/arabinose dehydrogenase
MNRTTLLASVAALPLYALSLLAQKPDLPPPFHTPSASNAAKVIERPDGVQLRVPAGFAVEEYASGFKKPRIMLNTPDGSILVTDSVPQGSVILLPAKGSRAERRELISGLDRPYGMAWWKDYLYVAEPTSLKRYKFDAKRNTVGPGQEVISLPGFDKGHWTRSVTFDPQGRKLYLDVGSGSNASPDQDERRATILECNPDGGACRIFASGLRNATTIAFRPGSRELWASVQERDGLGDDLVPDFFTRVQEGAFYGWPWAYYGPNEDPRNAGQRPEMVAKTVVPEISLGAHTAVIDWKFYTGKQFPQRYRNGVFFALRGSSNRSKRVGYSVVFLPFDKSGKPAGPVEDFLSGWMLSPDQREVWGRPTGVLQLPDGSLLVSDDGGNRIWRISYTGQGSNSRS